MTFEHSHASRSSAARARVTWKWTLAAFAMAPLWLGAKGCDDAIVGNDCPNGTVSADCGKGGASGKGGGGPVAGTGGQKPGVGGAPATGGVSTSGGAGPTPVDCGGLLGGGCERGEYCNYPIDAQCGAADQTGVCTAIPEACDLIYKPVCGCDDRTYGNACAAASAGVSVASEGECQPTQTGTDCGGLLGLQCRKGEYCRYDVTAMCGAADQTGTCMTLPEACADIYQPVCGCDGKTYGNECEAASVGVSVSARGECQPSTGQACGARLGDTCGKGEYCRYPLEAICGRADGTGTCEPIPSACDANRAPVCGCDGKTYANECEAASLGVSVDYKGECKSEGTICGGFAGFTCEKGEFCDYPLDAQCGIADGSGLCAPIPMGCTKEYFPVCGCNGQTYGNRCMAAADGVGVLREGACEPTGKLCGGDLPTQCARDEYCSYTLEANCGFADQGGVCQPLPEACTEEYAPVCGCDGKTYSNRCFAAAAGTSVQYTGECK